jgi:peptidyl-tRNA hydrolase, PTH2 family
MERQTKQVIIIRKGICGSRGKECSQAAHASMGALLNCFNGFKSKDRSEWIFIGATPNGIKSGEQWILRNEPIYKWLEGSFTKITVYVNTEEELLELERKAEEANLPNTLITDSGKTVFKGVPTKTALAIGPWWSDEIDKITGGLPLY